MDWRSIQGEGVTLEIIDRFELHDHSTGKSTKGRGHDAFAIFGPFETKARACLPAFTEYVRPNGSLIVCGSGTVMSGDERAWQKVLPLAQIGTWTPLGVFAVACKCRSLDSPACGPPRRCRSAREGRLYGNPTREGDRLCVRWDGEGT